MGALHLVVKLIATVMFLSAGLNKTPYYFLESDHAQWEAAWPRYSFFFQTMNIQTAETSKALVASLEVLTALLFWLAPSLGCSLGIFIMVCAGAAHISLGHNFLTFLDGLGVPLFSFVVLIVYATIPASEKKKKM